MILNSRLQVFLTTTTPMKDLRRRSEAKMLATGGGSAAIGMVADAFLGPIGGALGRAAGAGIAAALAGHRQYRAIQRQYHTAKVQL